MSAQRFGKGFAHITYGVLASVLPAFIRSNYCFKYDWRIRIYTIFIVVVSGALAASLPYHMVKMAAFVDGGFYGPNVEVLAVKIPSFRKRMDSSSDYRLYTVRPWIRMG